MNATLVPATVIGLLVTFSSAAESRDAAAVVPKERSVVALADRSTACPFVFVEIPAGRFAMGSPDTERGRAGDEGPVREVTISRPFFLGKYEVTQAQWQAIMGGNPSTFQDYAASPSHPIEGISWHDVEQFLIAFNARGLGRFRLPTEAEWEYAARAGGASRFPWGDDAEYRELEDHAWFYPRAEGRSHPVGSKLPNPYGLHDMFGGVWEWCDDWFGTYESAAAIDPLGPSAGTARVIRGGSWFNEPEALRSANRHRHEPHSRQTNIGFRLVWEPAAGPEAVVVERKPNGSLPDGYRAMSAATSGAWHVPVAGYQPPVAGEHPRLLFRRGDLPALRAKASTPEGRAIVRRLRFLLDGAEGETMTSHFNPATRFDDVQSTSPPDGTYTIGHAAGYGLLYQLTGDRKFAEFGRECFERALAGVRDRDSRYSYRQPGGALRAGPTLGWMAVGYDLCYDGWDADTRERLGRALLEYREAVEHSRPDRQEVTLPALARGTMPPFSNHFSMQAGGAALVLLALHREPWADHAELEALLDVTRYAMIRNLDEGFGDGGFFAEGDGTGSMSSHIVFLAALQAWRNAAGLDFINGPRPNARMLSLKWVYQTVFRDHEPVVWPIRGGYGKNVWSRTGMSGAAYFALGIGNVPSADRPAVTWCYDRFLAASDAERGTPFDTASVYPQYSVVAFVNWPVGERSLEPSQVLPHVYRDAVTGFFCWRDRWLDGNDTVITVLTNDVRGYMGADADHALAIHSRGRKLHWGTVAAGPPRFWHASPRGETSSLTLADGTAFAVDLSGASGADLMLVTTGEADGETVHVGDARLTFFFPDSGRQPEIQRDGSAAVVGRQRVTITDGNLAFGFRGE